MPHNSRPPLRKMLAVARLGRLRDGGVPVVLSAHLAWYLTGGVLGARGDEAGTVSLSQVALRVPDCEHFLPDYQAAAAA